MELVVERGIFHKNCVDYRITAYSEFACKYRAASNYIRPPRVETGSNTSTVVPASRKRRRRGTTVSEETVMYGYWSSVA
jgi:hypothetical protein